MRIAIVGGGISGLVAAHLLHPKHEIVLYEAGSYAGGHTNTIRVETARGTQDVDTGFIVMNDRNYPNFTRILNRLGVARQPTHMSFSVKSEQEDFEYAGTPRGLFCQPRNLLSLPFQRMIADLLRFNRELRAILEGAEPQLDERESLGEFLRRRRFSEYFVERLIVPQAAAVWSAEPGQMQSFPGSLPGRVLRQPWHARLQRQAPVVDHHRRLGTLRRSDHGALPGADPAQHSRSRHPATRRQGRGERPADWATTTPKPSMRS